MILEIPKNLLESYLDYANYLERENLMTFSHVDTKFLQMIKEQTEERKAAEHEEKL